MGYGVYRHRPLRRRISTRRLLADLVPTPARVTSVYTLTAVEKSAIARATSIYTLSAVEKAAKARVTSVYTITAVIPETVEPEFDPAVVLAGLSNPVWWAELYLDDGQKNISSVDLLDALGYYGGLKENVGATISEIKRECSDYDGNPFTAGFRLEWKDFARVYRAKLDNPATRNFLHRVVIVRAIEDADRRLELRPRIAGIGTIEDYGPIGDLDFFVECKSYDAKFAGIGGKDKVIPKGERDRTSHPGLPARLIGTSQQWVFGNAVDGASAANPPVLNGDPARGAFFVAEIPEGLKQYEKFPKTLWVMGWGNVPAGPAPPTNIIVAANAGGSINVGDFPNDTLQVIVTAVTGAGLEGDPHVFNQHATTTVVIVANGSKIDVTWTASVTPGVTYRVYLIYDFFNIHGGPANAQVLTTAGLTVSFTAAPRHGVAATPANITPGGSLPIWSRSRFYTVAALMAGGLTGISKIAWVKSFPSVRPGRIEWEAVAGAIEYWIFGEDTAEGVAQNKWSWKWSTAALFFEDDFTNTGATSWNAPVGSVGKVPLDPVGTRVSAFDGSTWIEFEVCRHACVEIVDLFLDGVRVDPVYYGTYALVPGKTGYSTYFPADPGAVCQYRDVLNVNGDLIRRTSVFGRGEIADQIFRGERVLTANVRGVESNGDSTGSLLTDGFDIYKYAAKNLLFDQQLTVPIVNGPFWPNSDVWEDAIPIVNEESFNRCKVLAQARIAGGYTLDFVLGANNERISIPEMIKRLNVSLGCFNTWDHRMRFSVGLIDEAIDLSTTRRVTQATDIVARSFSAPNLTRRLENIQFYSALYDWVRKLWLLHERTIPNAGAITDNLGVEQKSPIQEFYFTTNLAQIADILARRDILMAYSPREPQFVMTLPGTSIDTLDVYRLTHDNGVGANGFVDRPVFCLAHHLSLSGEFRVRFRNLDIDEYIDELGP